MYDDGSRLHNATLNTAWAIFSQFITVLLSLLTRKVFLNYLGAELLGVNSLFADVLMLFSFADLGFGTAIMFSMYQPIAEHDTKKVSSLLLMYRDIYRCVVFVLIIISLGFVPFLSYIKTNIAINNLIVYYFIFQLNNIAEYIWAYRENYIIACQRERELSKWNLVYNVTKSIVQIVSLMILHDFIIYLVSGLLCTAIKKILVNRYILINYPITALKNVEQLPRDEKKCIIRKSMALLITKVGNLIINQTDSLIVSYVISVVQWGYASNYLVIKKAIFTVSDKIYSAVLPSMGNLIVESDKDHQTDVFLKYDFMNAWMHTFFFVSFLCLSNPFITLFFGETAVLSKSFVFIFFLASFVDGLRSPVSVMREAGGSFEQDKWYTILAAVVNIIVSVPMSLIIGLNGVYIGTICSMFVLHFFRAKILLKNREYGVTTKVYLFIIVKHILVGLILGWITYIAVEWIRCLSKNRYFIFVIQCAFVGIIPNALWMLIYRNNSFMKVIVNKLLLFKEKRIET